MKIKCIPRRQRARLDYSSVIREILCLAKYYWLMLFFSRFCTINICLPVVIVKTVYWLNSRQNLKRIDWLSNNYSSVPFNHCVRKNFRPKYEIFTKLQHIVESAPKLIISYYFNYLTKYIIEGLRAITG